MDATALTMSPGTSRLARNIASVSEILTGPYENPLDPGHRPGRRVLDGEIPHEFHTTRPLMTHHPASPAKTRDAQNAMNQKIEAKRGRVPTLPPP